MTGLSKNVFLYAPGYYKINVSNWKHEPDTYEYERFKLYLKYKPPANPLPEAMQRFYTDIIGLHLSEDEMEHMRGIREMILRGRDLQDDEDEED